MRKYLLKRIHGLIWTLLPENREALEETSRDKMLGQLNAYEDKVHLEETIKWLFRAHDATEDSGVSRGFSAASISNVGYKGWEPSYPETTGYIIPTMIAAAEYLNDDSFVSRALKMADWEIDIQLSSGAVMGSVVTAKPSPAVFNTGQVILGWLAAFKKSGKQEYLDAATNAGDYLISVQGQDGSWDKGDSKFALKGSTTYNTRVAWALVELGIETDERKYIIAGRKNIDLALTKQLDNGWFSDNCLNDPKNPLLHTIVYATRGVLESGIHLRENRYIDAAIKTLDALLVCQRTDGGLPGRLDAKWSPQADWDCVTGNAQLAIAWLRAYVIKKNMNYEVAARNTIEFIKRSQNLEHPNPGFRGGVKGSFPFDGHYGQYEFLNWAAKFFCDALLLISDSDLARRGIKG